MKFFKSLLSPKQLTSHPKTGTRIKSTRGVLSTEDDLVVKKLSGQDNFWKEINEKESRKIQGFKEIAEKKSEKKEDKKGLFGKGK